MLIYMRPSNEATDVHSDLARCHFTDGGCGCPSNPVFYFSKRSEISAASSAA